MPRQVRIQYPGAVYHVMARGDRREAIFRDASDRRIFLEVLGAACVRTGWLCHAYVLMGNHYHLVLETPQPNLVAGMAWVQNTYTRRHNMRHQLWGHLFGGRYKAVLVEPEGGDYCATLIDYVHLNPARAGLSGLKDGLESFPWSSLGSYLGSASRRQPWQRCERGLGGRECAVWTSLDATGEKWRETIVNPDGMACEDLVLADLNGDGKLDIVASGRATKNVKVYFNETGL